MPKPACPMEMNGEVKIIALKRLRTGLPDASKPPTTASLFTLSTADTRGAFRRHAKICSHCIFQNSTGSR